MRSIGEASGELIQGVLDEIGKGNDAGLVAAEELLKSFPGDGRLHFLRGSLLASLNRYPEAAEALQRAVDLLPEYALARFQLGFLLLTMGEVSRAEAVLQPLQQLAPDDPLRLLALGLGHFVRDDFERAIALIQQGIERNPESSALNRDMSLLIEAVRANAANESEDAGAVSAVHLLLKHYSRDSK